MSALENIDHIVVLMLENRSFDSILGKLYPPSENFDGLTGTEFNLDAEGNQVRIWNASGTDTKTMSIPDPDPGELWHDINMQLFGTTTVSVPAPPAPMSGFVKNYLEQLHDDSGSRDPRSVMHYFSPEQVPVISKLAQQFAVCDRWFASAPCQTWPNRFFVHTGTANGYENNSPLHVPYLMETIYNRFELAGSIDWKIYFHDIAQAKTLTKLWLLSDHFHFFDEFKSDAAEGALPEYSFIEPRYFADWSMPNDQHPPHVVTLGEQLIAEVYNSLRNGKNWTKTLLIITYDEHGGCYDHVAPPSATPPSKTATSPFNFDRYGVRVPTIIISPFVRAGTILRAPGNVPYDHTSIIATLRKRFPELGAPLTERDAVAPDLSDALALDEPTNLGPERIDALPYGATPALVAQTQKQPLNNMQHGLVHLAANLPAGAGSKNKEAINHHIGMISARPNSPPPAAIASVRDAAAYIKQQLGEFFA